MEPLEADLGIPICGSNPSTGRSSHKLLLTHPGPTSSGQPALGLIYLAAGIAHFTEAEGFTNITPPNGSWGFWWTPFSPKVNTLWTGVVEVFGGAWLLFGAAAPLLGLALPPELGPVASDGALTLFLLTIIVTPANIYALTHGANFPLDVETPPAAHGVRLAFQSVLLAMFWEMAQTTVLDFKVNMGLMTAAEAARAAVPM